MIRIRKFNEEKSSYLELGKEILNNILNISINLDDDFINYDILPDPSNEIHIFLLGMYLNGGTRRIRFEIQINTKNLDDAQKKTLFIVIKQLKNYLESESITCLYELEYEKMFPKREGRLGERTNIIKSNIFDESMLNNVNYFGQDNLCRKLIIKFEKK